MVSTNVRAAEWHAGYADFKELAVRGCWRQAWSLQPPLSWGKFARKQWRDGVAAAVRELYEKEEETVPNRMSKDRVEFTAAANHGEHEEAAKVAARAFNVSERDARRWFDEERRIRCRPSQFARFLIYRNEAGLTNQFKLIRPKLIPHTPDVCDVSGHDHCE